MCGGATVAGSRSAYRSDIAIKGSLPPDAAPRNHGNSVWVFFSPSNLIIACLSSAMHLAASRVGLEVKPSNCPDLLTRRVCDCITSDRFVARYTYPATHADRDPRTKVPLPASHPCPLLLDERVLLSSPSCYDDASPRQALRDLRVRASSLVGLPYPLFIGRYYQYGCALTPRCDRANNAVACVVRRISTVWPSPSQLGCLFPYSGLASYDALVSPYLTT